MNWTEISLEINADDIDKAAAIANMTVPYGIYIEDYRNLEEETWEIANIDLIDEELLKKDRTKGFIHIYIPEDENPSEAVSYLSERLKAENIPNKIDLSVCKNEDWEKRCSPVLWCWRPAFWCALTWGQPGCSWVLCWWAAALPLAMC